MDDLTDFCVAENDFADGRSEHAGHSCLDIINAVIDDTVETHIDAVFFSQCSCIGIRTDVEADDQRIGGRCQHDIGFVDGADSGVDDGNADFITLDAHEGLNRALQRSPVRLP